MSNENGWTLPLPSVPPSQQSDGSLCAGQGLNASSGRWQRMVDCMRIQQTIHLIEQDSDVTQMMESSRYKFLGKQYDLWSAADIYI